MRCCCCCFCCRDRWASYNTVQYNEQYSTVQYSYFSAGSHLGTVQCSTVLISQCCAVLLSQYSKVLLLLDNTALVRLRSKRTSHVLWGELRTSKDEKELLYGDESTPESILERYARNRPMMLQRDN